MRLIKPFILVGYLLVWAGNYIPTLAQNDTIRFSSLSYFSGMSFVDSMMQSGNYAITIAPKEVKIIEVNHEDQSKNRLYLQRRTMSGIKYSTLDGRQYIVWKLGDRKMILREQDGRRYLSLYRTDDYGLPAEYITFILEE